MRYYSLQDYDLMVSYLRCFGPEECFMALRRLTVESWAAMVKSLEESAKRQRRILEDTEAKLSVAQEMMEQARKESAQTDLVGQATKR